jgi:hypothetical protein
MADALDVLWKNVLERWEDDAVHQAFLQHCRNGECLGEAAARYAGMETDADKGPAARKRLEAVAALAAASLQASREPRRTFRAHGLIVLAAAMLGALAAYVLLRALLL